MAKGRTKTFKYKNYIYTDEISKLLLTPLNNTDESNLNIIMDKYASLEVSRGYEYIIRDLYILTQKHSLTTTQLSSIYCIGIRTVQIWLKELGLNRNLYDAKEAFNTSVLKDIDINKLNNTNTTSSPSDLYGITNKDNLDLPYYISDFLTYLETIKGKSKNTIIGYKIDLCLFLRFEKLYKGLPIPENLEFEEIPINDLDEAFISSIELTDLYAFLSYVEKNRNNSSYARARKVATLKSFFKFLHMKAKIIKDNPTIELESPKINKRHPIFLTLDESMTLLSSLDKENANYYRDYCILTLFLNCGMRLSELCSIQVDKIRDDTLTIIGKGSKERTVYLNTASLNSINDYLKVRDPSKCLEKDSNFLFLSNRYKPINKRTVELLVSKHLKNADIKNDKYTPHKLRHTAATLMYKHGNVDIRSLQEILGHENISTTQIYTHIDDDSLRKAANSNPLANFEV